MDRGGRGVPDPSIALNCGERLPTFGGGGGLRGGAWLISKECVLFLSIGVIMCLFIIGPRVDGLKGANAHRR